MLRIELFTKYEEELIERIVYNVNAQKESNHKKRFSYVEMKGYYTIIIDSVGNKIAVEKHKAASEYTDRLLNEALRRLEE